MPKLQPLRNTKLKDEMRKTTSLTVVLPTAPALALGLALALVLVPTLALAVALINALAPALTACVKHCARL